MDSNNDNKIDSSNSNKNAEITVKRNKSKNKNSTTSNSIENQFKRTFFGSRRKKKEATATDSSTTGEQNVPKSNGNTTEPDAGLRKPATNEIRDFEDVPKGALMVTEPHAEEYFMSHLRRGKAIIFNHEYFEKEDRREGTKIDVDRITQVFGQLLQFEVEVHNDLDYVDIITQIARLTKEDFTNSDCIAIFVLSHGKKGGEISARDMYYPADKLWEYFAGDKCVTLAGKPKLFFISACRGRKKDSGIRLFRGRTQTDSSNKQITYKLPNQADFLIANSTVEGYYSYRDIKNGTWFIQCLCDVLTEYYETKDLMKMLTITSRKVAIDYRSISDRVEDSDLTQIPSVTTMLIRDVFFRKKELEQ